MTVLKPNVILTATVLSNSYIDSAVWYRLNEKLQNSTKLYQKMIHGKITAIFYEVAVEVEGFIVSMKTTNQDFEDTNMNYSLELRNEFGITTTFFNMSNHQGKLCSLVAVIDFVSLEKKSQKVIQRYYIIVSPATTCNLLVSLIRTAICAVNISIKMSLLGTTCDKFSIQYTVGHGQINFNLLPIFSVRKFVL